MWIFDGKFDIFIAIIVIIVLAILFGSVFALHSLFDISYSTIIYYMLEFIVGFLIIVMIYYYYKDTKLLKSVKRYKEGSVENE